MPVKAVGVGVVVEGPALTVVGVAHAEDDGLTVFLVSAVLTGNSIAAWTVFRTVKRHAVNGNGDLAASRSAFVIAVGFWTIRSVVAACGVVDRRAGDGPLVVLGARAIVALRAGQGGLKIMVRQAVGHNGDVGFVHRDAHRAFVSFHCRRGQIVNLRDVLSRLAAENIEPKRPHVRSVVGRWRRF